MGVHNTSPEVVPKETSSESCQGIIFLCFLRNKSSLHTKNKLSSCLTSIKKLQEIFGSSRLLYRPFDKFWSKPIIFDILAFSYCSSPLPLVSMLRLSRKSTHLKLSLMQQHWYKQKGKNHFVGKNAFGPKYFCHGCRSCSLNFCPF